MWLTGVQKRCSQTPPPETSFELKLFPPGHFWMWTTAPVLNHFKRWGTGSSCWHNRKMVCRCTPPPTHREALLLSDTNYNVRFVLCPTLRTRTSVHRCIHMETSCSIQTHTHTNGYWWSHTNTNTHLRDHGSANETLQATIQRKRLFPNVLSQPGMIQFPLWPTANTTLSRPILSNSPIQLYGTFQHRRHASLFMLNHNPNGIKNKLRNM